MTNIKNYFVFFSMFVLVTFILACSKPDINADVNETLEATWNVTSILEDGAEVFPSLYTAQSYNFVADKEFKAEGEVTIVSAPVGGTGAVTEEFDYVISGNGLTIAWNSSARGIMINDTILTISSSNRTIRATKEE